MSASHRKYKHYDEGGCNWCNWCSWSCLCSCFKCSCCKGGFLEWAVDVHTEESDIESMLGTNKTVEGGNIESPVPGKPADWKVRIISRSGNTHIGHLSLD